MFMEMSVNYKKCLEKGQVYEQWVIRRWPEIYPQRKLTLKKGLIAQLTGETLEGVEIKFDDLIYWYDPNGRVYIEVEEKANAENNNYVISGIYRNDNTKLYLVGDYSIWFLFSKKYLQWLDKLDPPFLFRPKPTPTSRGFCIPIKNAKKLCLDYQEF